MTITRKLQCISPASQPSLRCTGEGNLSDPRYAFPASFSRTRDPLFLHDFRSHGLHLLQGLFFFFFCLLSCLGATAPVSDSPQIAPPFPGCYCRDAVGGKGSQTVPPDNNQREREGGRQEGRVGGKWSVVGNGHTDRWTWEKDSVTERER